MRPYYFNGLNHLILINVDYKSSLPPKQTMLTGNLTTVPSFKTLFFLRHLQVPILLYPAGRRKGHEGSRSASKAKVWPRPCNLPSVDTHYVWHCMDKVRSSHSGQTPGSPVFTPVVTTVQLTKNS